MTLKINTTSKTIEIEGNCKIQDIIEFCNKHNLDIKEYSLVKNEVNYPQPYTCPIITYPKQDIYTPPFYVTSDNIN